LNEKGRPLRRPFVFKKLKSTVFPEFPESDFYRERRSAMPQFLRLILALSLLLMLLGCSKFTRQNYAKITVGSKYADIVKIFGEPGSCSEAPYLKSCIWGNEQKNITVKFMHDKVISFTSTNIK
jgi:hypothetical protein